jgi:hypothetical protein
MGFNSAFKGLMDSKNARFTYARHGDMLGKGDAAPLKLDTSMR